MTMSRKLFVKPLAAAGALAVHLCGWNGPAFLFVNAEVEIYNHMVEDAYRFLYVPDPDTTTFKPYESGFGQTDEQRGAQLHHWTTPEQDVISQTTGFLTREEHGAGSSASGAPAPSVLAAGGEIDMNLRTFTGKEGTEQAVKKRINGNHGLFMPVNPMVITEETKKNAEDAAMTYVRKQGEAGTTTLTEQDAQSQAADLLERHTVADSKKFHLEESQADSKKSYLVHWWGKDKSSLEKKQKREEKDRNDPEMNIQFFTPQFLDDGTNDIHWYDSKMEEQLNPQYVDRHLVDIKLQYNILTTAIRKNFKNSDEEELGPDWHVPLTLVRSVREDKKNVYLVGTLKELADFFGASGDETTTSNRVADEVDQERYKQELGISHICLTTSSPVSVQEDVTTPSSGDHVGGSYDRTLKIYGEDASSTGFLGRATSMCGSRVEQRGNPPRGRKPTVEAKVVDTSTEKYVLYAIQNRKGAPKKPMLTPHDMFVKESGTRTLTWDEEAANRRGTTGGCGIQ
ncbi:unnamed protein product [Amoebophrya sp. A120]|nr:unnamed protein product [Amoebophrya sp. A120]|eukprot:GSA120T00025063001.1